VGSNVLGTTSTNTRAQAQILIGSSLAGGLLLNSDSATGSDFFVGGNTNPTPTPTPTATPTPTPSPTPTITPTPSPTPAPSPNASAGGRFDERYSGTLSVGQNFVEVRFELRRAFLDAQINQNQGNQQIYFELLDANRNLIATAGQQKIQLDGLTTGSYIYRVRGSVSKAVDFTIKSGQGR
jgi:hypothetical protein